ncbi:MAG TPA: hypothetical protein ENJ09_05615, partial [Planctomycetes bacterium]|nr:hypothetical protein [Planctomycetota bacterium]
MAILLLLLALLGENRLFVGRVELVGPVSEVRFDCGAAGEVRLRADLVEGERRGVEIPFPVRSPLGIDALDDVPAPRVVEPARGVRFAGWSEAQPAARFAVLPLGLTSRTRPPLARGGAGGAGGAGVGLAIALATGLGVLALRRRAGLALCVGLAGGFFAAVVPGLFRGATGTRAGESVIEVEAGVE